ncbi:hypothetical protein BY996DRAFT_6414082 [Phakopsora pachyrhizi]|nr:hypothetical protein BY996DRAFT_6414082 [Phakopsora pachyrhizi]
MTLLSSNTPHPTPLKKEASGSIGGSTLNFRPSPIPRSVFQSPCVSGTNRTCSNSIKDNFVDVSGGGPIPEEDLIDLTSDQEKENDSNPEVEAQQLPAARKIKMSQATGGSKQTHKNIQKQYKSKAIVESGDEAKTNSEREKGEILEAVNAVVLDTEADLTNSNQITDIQVFGGVNGENIILVPAAVTTQDISAKATSTNHVAPADQTVPADSTNPLITFVNPNTTFTTQNALNTTTEIIHNGPQSSVDSTPKNITVLLNDEVRVKVHESWTWFGQGNLRSEKLSYVQSSVKTFVELCNQPQEEIHIGTTPSFQLICSDGLARGWTKDINKFTAQLLKPAANEAWFCLDFIDIKKISQIKLPEKKDDPMIKQNLISFLGDLSIPGKLSANLTEAKDDKPSTAVVEQRKSLDKLSQRHNYLPFCMFMVAGVRGILLAPKDHCHLKGANSLGILESLNIIYKRSTNNQRVEEVYWKELGKYSNKLFYKTFHTSGSMFNFQQPLTLELAKAVATDFLNS